MSTDYPGAIDNSPATHGDVWDSVHAIETELGIDPSGTSASVAARLTAINGAGQVGTYVTTYTDPTTDPKYASLPVGTVIVVVSA